MRAFAEIYPCSIVINQSFNQVVLIGSKKPIILDSQSLRQKFDGMKTELESLSLSENDILLWQGFVSPINREALQESGVPSNSDRNLFVEGRIAKYAYIRETQSDIERMKGLLKDMLKPETQPCILNVDSRKAGEIGRGMIENRYVSGLRKYALAYKGFESYLPDTFLLEDDFEGYRNFLSNRAKKGDSECRPARDPFRRNRHDGESTRTGIAFIAGRKRHSRRLRLFHDGEFAESFRSYPVRSGKPFSRRHLKPPSEREEPKISEPWNRESKIRIPWLKLTPKPFSKAPRTTVAYAKATQTYIQYFDAKRRDIVGRLDQAEKRKDLMAVEYYASKALSLDKAPDIAVSLSAVAKIRGNGLRHSRSSKKSSLNWPEVEQPKGTDHFHKTLAEKSQALWNAEGKPMRHPANLYLGCRESKEKRRT
ncbi:MAG: hypothetical protein MZV70_47250 [Desulfobacterales bacterium]|nr:hypothetical protein [Desulfobacterales bacterium]